MSVGKGRWEMTARGAGWMQGWRLACVGLALGALGWTAGCKDDAGGEGGDFASVDKPVLSALPESVTFDATAINETNIKQVAIFNSSSTTAKVNFRIVEQPTAQDRNREFTWGPGFEQIESGTIEIGPNQTYPIDVAYTPRDAYNDSGHIQLTYNGGGELRVPLRTTETAPDINSQSRVIFGRVPAGGVVTRDLVIQNIGRAPLELYNMEFGDGGAEFSFCFPQGDDTDREDEEAPPCLDPDEFDDWKDPLPYEGSQTVRITYAPVDDGEDSTQLLIESNDPEFDDAPYVVDIIGNGSEPCIVVSDEAGVDFGNAFIGGVSERTLTITNCSPNKPLEVSSIKMADGSDAEFYIDDAGLPPGLPDEMTVIDIGNTASFVVSYAPTAEAANEGQIEILSNDSAKSPLLIPVNGRGSNNACPTATAKARVQGDGGPYFQQIEAVPLDTIELNGSDSTDPDNPGAGAIDRYEWTIIEKPADSTTRFSPRASAANPTLFIDLAGRYVLELRVYDSTGVPSCNASQITIVATPNEDIHIQLVWDTDGTDVDLHFLHPSGRWDRAPWDVYYLNREPNWGSPGATDNPSLDIDDVDGHGPENINLDNPESVTYRVGALYFSDHGRGATNSTIRIWLQSVLVFEYRGKYMTDRQFWDVAAIEWGVRPEAVQIDNLTNGVP